jgi:hypothetical protein
MAQPCNSNYLDFFFALDVNLSVQEVVCSGKIPTFLSAFILARWDPWGASLIQRLDTTIDVASALE